ncbi:MAG: N-acetylgalactosamine-4-sulfatase, partial [Planctomycetota bacterium]
IRPTLIDLCDIAAPKGVKFDGVSIRPLLDNNARDWPDRVLVTDSQRVKDPIMWRKSSVMTSRWRLVNGKELYDMPSDPAQERDVAKQHPEVVARLTAFYEHWWADISPSFSQATAISLGHPADNPARLTSHDWITTQMTPWNQSQVRGALNGAQNTGFWNVNVTSSGNYEIRLRRWPQNINLAINAPLAPGAPVPGAKSFRETPGKAINPVKATLEIAGQKLEAKVKPGAKEVVFNLKLPAGRTQMTGQFIEKNGDIYGSYFAYVTKK